MKFADDTKFFKRVDSEEDYRGVLQWDLDRLVDLSEVWQMRFNVDKCSDAFGEGNPGGSNVMNEGTLGAVNEEWDLGVRNTSDLKNSANRAHVCTRVLGMIARTVVYRSPDVLTRLYKSLVRPHLEYCVSAWSPHYVKDRERL